MNHLTNRNQGYPFSFFTEKAFHREQVINYIVEAYTQLSHHYPVIQPNTISHRDHFTFTLGTIGRIVKLEEDHYDLFFGEWENERIRELSQHHNGDLIKVAEDFLEQGSVSLGAEKLMLFEKDIKTVFEMENIFYVDSDIPYDSMLYLRRSGDGHPFSEENFKKIFRNFPLVQVW